MHLPALTETRPLVPRTSKPEAWYRGARTGRCMRWFEVTWEVGVGVTSTGPYLRRTSDLDLKWLECSLDYRRFVLYFRARSRRDKEGYRSPQKA
jgi:hypothetical protein